MFKDSFLLSELNNIFLDKDFKIFTFNVKLTDDVQLGERPNKKNIQSFDLTRKVNLLGLWRVKYMNLVSFSRRRYYRREINVFCNS